jgi:hypothetical protein
MFEYLTELFSQRGQALNYPRLEGEWFPIKGRLNPVVALNFALRFIKPLAIKGRLLNQCHLLD